MRLSRSIREQWDEILSAHEVQGIRNERGTLVLAPKEYGRLRLLSPLPAKLTKAEAEEKEELPELVVGGYASPQVVDKERHLITKEAMVADLPRFLAHPKYRNANVVHSNIQVGEVLPDWTHPETGEVYKTQVDDIGLFAVVKVRTDPFRPAIVDKVIEDIQAGKLAAFSISGDAPHDSRQYQCNDGSCFWIINKIEYYEITLASLPGTKVQVSGGVKAVEDVVPGDQVITHRRRLRPVTEVGKVAFDGEVIEIDLDDGTVLKLTPEHSVRVRGKGWVPAGELREDDELYSGVPNRLGEEQPEEFVQKWHEQHPAEGRRGGIRTAEGRERQRRSVTTPEFRRLRSEIMKQKWSEPHYRAAALAKLAETAHVRGPRSEQARRKVSENLRQLRQDPLFNEAMYKAMRMSPNRVELELQKRLGPLGFWYTGDGKLVTSSGLVPDFHDGEGRVVEVFGDYWHAGEDPTKRVERLRADGYETLVLWEREVKSDLDGCERRVREFCGA